MNNQGKRMEEIELGHKTETIIISIDTLNINNVPSLQYLDLANLSTLRGTLNLSSATHLKELLASGTNLTSITFPNGGGLNRLEMGSRIINFELKNHPFITNDNISLDGYSSLNTVTI